MPLPLWFRGRHAAIHRLLVRLDHADHVPRDGLENANDGAEPHGTRSALPARDSAPEHAIPPPSCHCCLMRSQHLFWDVIMISFVLFLLCFRVLPRFNAACSSWDRSCWEYGCNYAGRGGSDKLGDGTEYMRSSRIWRSVFEILYYFTDLVQK